MTDMARFYDLRQGLLRIRHNQGLFSNCTVAMHGIVSHFNQFGVVPGRIDFRPTFANFKDPGAPEINAYPRFFTPDPDVAPPLQGPVEFPMLGLFDYHGEDLAGVLPFVARYFGPSAPVLARAQALRERYDLDPDRTLGICYRGTDKWRDTGLGTFDEYIERAKSVMAGGPPMRVLVQTDQAQFLDRCRSEFDDPVWFEELPVTEGDEVMHKVVQRGKIRWAQNLIAAVLLLARCRHLVLHTGNVARWICLYRGHSRGVSQYFRPRDVEPGGEAKGVWFEDPVG